MPTQAGPDRTEPKTYEEYILQYHGMNMPMTRERWNELYLQHPPKRIVPRHLEKAVAERDQVPKCKHGWENCEECKFGKYTPFKTDSINPTHYKSHPSGVECIQITRHMTFNLGNAIKYIWRHEQKNGLEDLKKARWYFDDEIKRLENETSSKV